MADCPYFWDSAGSYWLGLWSLSRPVTDEKITITNKPPPANRPQLTIFSHDLHFEHRGPLRRTSAVRQAVAQRQSFMSTWRYIVSKAWLAVRHRGIHTSGCSFHSIGKGWLVNLVYTDKQTSRVLFTTSKDL